MLRTKKWVLVSDGRKSRSRLKRTKTSTVSFNCELKIFSLIFKNVNPLVPVKENKNIHGKFAVIAEIKDRGH